MEQPIIIYNFDELKIEQCRINDKKGIVLYIDNIRVLIDKNHIKYLLEEIK
jgi:hypothetical protein